MQAQRLATYLKDPSRLQAPDVAELQQLVKDFPYFQTGHLLLTLAARRWDSSVYQQSLKKTAIVVSNRTQLFQLLQNLDTLPASPPQVEAPLAPAVATAAATVAAVPPSAPPAPENNTPPAEATRQELDILKAAELSADQAAETSAAAETASASVPASPEELLEQEIGKQVVAAFVEKELLDTPALHHVKREDPESFVDWLNLLKKNNGQSYEQIHAQVTAERAKLQQQKTKETAPAEGTQDPLSRKEKNRSIIDSIIEKNPGAIRARENQKFFNAEIKARESLLESEHLVTETLARIYALQGSVNKAIRAYEILSLKYPQKSAYFANLIQKLKTNQ